MQEGQGHHEPVAGVSCSLSREVPLGPGATRACADTRVSVRRSVEYKEPETDRQGEREWGRCQPDAS